MDLLLLLKESFLLQVGLAMIAILATPIILLWLGKREPFLKPDKWQELPLIKKEVVSHNTRRFRFALPHTDQPVGLPVGQHIALRALLPDGTELMKPYTPVSDIDERGQIEFVIKVYPEGKMSRHLDGMRIGERLWFKGPRGRFQYNPNMKRHIGMLAGGTGITPMFQVAHAILKDPSDSTNLSLIYANVTRDDILIKDELDYLAGFNHSRFNVYYVLNEAPADWKGGVGFVTPEMILEHLPPPGDGTLICRCGPPAMNKAMRGHLLALGYTQDMLFEF